MSFWKKLFGVKPGQSSDKWVVRVQKENQYVYINFGEKNALNALKEPNSAVVSNPENAEVTLELFQTMFAHFLRIGESEGTSSEFNTSDFLIKLRSEAGRNQLVLETTADVQMILAKNFRRLEIVSKLELFTAEAVPLDQAVKDYKNSKTQSSGD